jgi:recombination protein RecT
VICLDISYIGLIDLAVASGSILWAQANIVREHDNFVVNGFDKPPSHGHDPFAGAAARGAIKGAYVVVKTPDGEYLTHTMDIESIYAVRDRSESWAKKKAGPWATDEGEMIKKTVVKQAQKYWPKTERSGRLDEAIHHLNTEGGEGFEAINGNGSKKYPAGELQEWVRLAGEAASTVDLSTIWTKGLASIKPSKDLDAYNAFKQAVADRGQALKQPKPSDEVMDVEAKEVSQ